VYYQGYTAPVKHSKLESKQVHMRRKILVARPEFIVLLSVAIPRSAHFHCTTAGVSLIKPFQCFFKGRDLGYVVYRSYQIGARPMDFSNEELVEKPILFMIRLRVYFNQQTILAISNRRLEYTSLCTS